MPKAVGMIELSSIAIGYSTQDAMLKAANVNLLIARTICSGKYIVIVGGEASEVSSSVEVGLQSALDAVIDHMILPKVHESVFPALAQSTVLKESELEALGVVETFTAASILEAADAAAKAASVYLFRIHVAMAVGGKGFLMLTGDVSSVNAAVDAAAAVAIQRGVLVGKVVIPRPSRELFSEYI